MGRFRLDDDGPNRQTPAMQRVIEIDPIEDPQALYEKLEKLGKLPMNELFNRHVIQVHLNEAAQNYHQARQLHLTLLKEQDSYARATHPELADVRRTALKRLTDWIRVQDASRRKTVTDEMVMDQVFAAPDLAARYNAVMDRLADMRQAVGVTESLVDSWKNRMFLLQGMSNALPKVSREE